MPEEMDVYVVVLRDIEETETPAGAFSTQSRAENFLNEQPRRGRVVHAVVRPSSDHAVIVAARVSPGDLERFAGVYPTYEAARAAVGEGGLVLSLTIDARR